MGQEYTLERKLDEEKKIDENEDELDDYFGVPSLVAFSGALRSSEALLVSDQSEEDQNRGTEITYGNAKFNFTSYTRLCQMIGMLPNKAIGTGPCTRVRLNNEDYIISCAHNFCSVSSLRNTTHMFEKVRVFEGREGDTWKQFWTCNVQETYVHPKYNGVVDCGFDIGVSRIRKRTHKLNGTAKIDEKSTVDDCDVGIGDPKDIVEGMTVEVAGSVRGIPFTSEGKILSAKSKANGGCMVFYKLETTPADSGGCIMIKDKNYIAKHCEKRGVSKLIIGVHTGHDGLDGIHFGTLISPQAFKWITSLG